MEVHGGMLTTNLAALDVGAEWLPILPSSYFVDGWRMVSVQAFNGAGATVTMTKIDVLFVWLLQIPLLWPLAPRLDLQAAGVFWLATDFETLVELFTLRLKTRWKQKVKRA